jgi:hypothetical protein
MFDVSSKSKEFDFTAARGLMNRWIMDQIFKTDPHRDFFVVLLGFNRENTTSSKDIICIRNICLG